MIERLARGLLLAVMCASCRRAPDAVHRDPTPAIVDAAPKPTPTATKRAVLHGRIVDLTDGAVIHALREKVPRDEASDDRAAFVLDADDMLRAYDLASGKLQWEVPTTGKRLAIDDQRICIAEGPELAVVVRATGAVVRHKIALATGPFEEVHLVRGHAIFRQGYTQLAVLDVTTGAMRASKVLTTALDAALDGRHLALMPTLDGLCYVTFEPPEHVVQCADLDLKPRIRTVLALSKPSDPPYTRFGLRAIGRNHLVIATWGFGSFPAARRSAVVRLSDGKEIVRVEDEVAALIERPDGSLDGLIVVEPEIRLLTPAGVERWHVKPKWVEHFARAVVHGDRLVMATYNMIATGVQVFALSLTDGRTLWTGETKLPPIGHSKYYNAVELELRGDAVILHGHESSVEHAHLYDAATGALRFSDAPHK